MVGKLLDGPRVFDDFAEVKVTESSKALFSRHLGPEGGKFRDVEGELDVILFVHLCRSDVDEGEAVVAQRTKDVGTNFFLELVESYSRIFEQIVRHPRHHFSH